MNWQSQITQQIANLTNRLNAITTNAKKIFELPWQSSLDTSSEIHVSKSGTSEKVNIQQIIDAALSVRQNQLVSIGTITVSGNDVTVPANAQWIINNINYSNPADIIINVPYALEGNTRTDILVGDTSNNIYRVSGPETEGVSPSPNTPLDTVLITTVSVTDSTIGYVPPVIGDEYVLKSDYHDDNNVLSSTIDSENTGNIRNDQPTFVKLDNGDIVVAYNHFGAAEEDDSFAQIWRATSTDGGKTWETPVLLQGIVSGAINSLVPSFYKKTNGNILMLFFAQTAPTPTPLSKIYKIEYDQNFNVISGPTDLGLASGYYSPASDRLFYDTTTSKLFYSTAKLISGNGASFTSVYESRLLQSSNEGTTWADTGLSIGQNIKILDNTVGGATEPGVFRSPLTGLVVYFRTLTGNIYAQKLSDALSKSGSEYALMSASNAQSSIKYWDSKKLLVAARTRLIDNNPIGSNVRKYLDLLTSTDGNSWNVVQEIDNVKSDTDWYVNQPILFVDDARDNLIVGYNKSITSSLYASLLSKVYSSNFMKFEYESYPVNGFSDNGKGKIYDGFQIRSSSALEPERNVVSLRNPVGGVYANVNSSSAGAIKITLPNNQNTFIVIRGFISQGASDKVSSFEIACNLSDMSNNSVNIFGKDVLRNLNIRFVNGSKPIIFIGELASTWNYLNVYIDSVKAFFVANLEELYTGWNIALETSSFGTVVSTKKTISKIYDNGTSVGFGMTNPDPAYIAQFNGDIAVVSASNKIWASKFATWSGDMEFDAGGSGNNHVFTGGTLQLLSLTTYSNDAAADADSGLRSKGLYKISGNRAVFQKP